MRAKQQETGQRTEKAEEEQFHRNKNEIFFQCTYMGQDQHVGLHKVHSTAVHLAALSSSFVEINEWVQQSVLL